MTVPTLYNVSDIDLYNIFINFITDNVTDIRSSRKNKRWVFDQFPHEDSNYPEVVVEIADSSIVSGSAAQILNIEKDASGNVTKEVYFMQEECPVKLRILTLKDTDNGSKTTNKNRFEVTINGTTRYLRDKAVNLYLNKKIKDLFFFKYVDLIKNYKYQNYSIIEKVRVETNQRIYEGNERTWVTDVIVNIKFNNLYIKEYDGTGELINEYSLVLNLETS